jgi:hypothetical protein
MAKYRVQIKRKERREPLINRELQAPSADAALTMGIEKGMSEICDFTPDTARVVELGGDRRPPQEAKVIPAGKTYRFEWIAVRTTPKAA